tara:strand:- start:319 stop:1080 length:762 start_codon:yes stop_codon:yes gene_type:complete
MAVQYSLSYDADGNPSLVKNTVEGKAPVIKTDFTIGEYKPTRTVSTDYEFTSTSSDTFSREKQLEILNIFIRENDSDSGPVGTIDDSFQTLAAKDDKGNIIGGLTFKEKAKLSAFTYSQTPKTVTSVIESIVPFGNIIGPIARTYGERQLDSYYDPKHPMYDYTGFGADLAEGDVSKPGMGYDEAYGSKFSKTNAIAEASELAYDPNKTKTINTPAYDYDNNNNDTGHAGGQAAADAAASQAADDEAAGAGGY